MAAPALPAPVRRLLLDHALASLVMSLPLNRVRYAAIANHHPSCASGGIARSCSQMMELDECNGSGAEPGATELTYPGRLVSTPPAFACAQPAVGRCAMYFVQRGARHEEARPRFNGPGTAVHAP